MPAIIKQENNEKQKTIQFIIALLLYVAGSAQPFAEILLHLTGRTVFNFPQATRFYSLAVLLLLTGRMYRIISRANQF